MTMTVKLAPSLESELRQRSAALGRPASELMREALQLWLTANPAPPQSAFDAGRELFGKYRGAPDLAQNRKSALDEDLVAKHARRALKPARGG